MAPPLEHPADADGCASADPRAPVAETEGADEATQEGMDSEAASALLQLASGSDPSGPTKDACLSRATTYEADLCKLDQEEQLKPDAIAPPASPMGGVKRLRVDS